MLDSAALRLRSAASCLRDGEIRLPGCQAKRVLKSLLSKPPVESLSAPPRLASSESWTTSIALHKRGAAGTGSLALPLQVQRSLLAEVLLGASALRFALGH